MLKTILTIFLCIGIGLNVFSQNILFSDICSKILEEYAGNDSYQEEIEIISGLLDELSEKPVKINTGDEHEISRIFFLTDFQVKSLAGYVRTTGKIISHYEIAAIPGFDSELAGLLVPFITLEAKETTVLSRKPAGNFTGNLVAGPVFRDSTAPGGPLKLLTKYRITAGSFEAGITAEKDRGEKLFPPGSHLPDFFSGHISYSGKGIIRTIIAGDFSAKFGQGLAVNTGMSTFTSLSSPSMLMIRDELKPYTSAEENRFFRGLAVRLLSGRTAAVIFASDNRADATAIYDSISGQQVIKSLYTGGLHTSDKLLEKRDILEVKSFGINLSREFETARAGIVLTGSFFSLPFAVNSADPQKINDFTGKVNRVLSFHYKKSIRGLLLFGELAFNRPERYALIQGLNLRSGGLLNASLFYKEYGKGFTAFYSSVPGLSSGSGYQRSVSSVINLEPAEKIFLSCGSEITWYPWLRYRSGFPSRAERTEIRISCKPKDNLEFEIAAGRRLSMLDDDCDQGLAPQKVSEYRQIRSMLRYTPVNNLTLTGRFFYKRMTGSGEEGMLLAHDLVYSFRKMALTLWARYCIFHTESWNSRLYIYENDLLYSFSMPAYSGRGARTYLMAKYDFGERGELRVKYGKSLNRKPDDTNEYENDIRLQLRLFF